VVTLHIKTNLTSACCF